MPIRLLAIIAVLTFSAGGALGGALSGEVDATDPISARLDRGTDAGAVLDCQRRGREDKSGNHNDACDAHLNPSAARADNEVLPSALRDLSDPTAGTAPDSQDEGAAPDAKDAAEPPAPPEK